MVYRSREDVYRSRKNSPFSQEPAELYAREGQLRLPPCLAEMGGGTAALVQLSEVLDGADHLRGVAVLVVVPGHDLHLVGVEAAKRLPIRLSSTSNVGKNVNEWQKRLPYQAPHGLSYHCYSLSYQQSQCNFLSNVVNILCLCIYNILPFAHH